MWINIEGYEGKYQISEHGSVSHITPSGANAVTPCIASNGKYYVSLWKDGKRKVYMLHNLLSDAYAMSVEDACRVLYEGYSGYSSAKENVRRWLLELIVDCEKDTEKYHDELLYLRKFLKEVSS